MSGVSTMSMVMGEISAREGGVLTEKELVIDDMAKGEKLLSNHFIKRVIT